jgi:hypothetical protein
MSPIVLEYVLSLSAISEMYLQIYWHLMAGYMDVESDHGGRGRLGNVAFNVGLKAAKRTIS